MKSLKLFVVVLALTLTFNLLQAQQNVSLENSVLWKVERADLEQPSYIFGTLHLMCEEDFKMPKKVIDTFENVEALVLEIDLSDPREMQLMQQSMSNSEKISEVLTSEEFIALDSLVTKQMGVGLSNFDAYGLSILNAVMMTKMLPCTTFKSIENELIVLATENQKPIKSLEKAAQQIEMLESAYPTAFAYKQLMLFDSYKKDFNEAIIAYLNEDIDKIMGLLAKEDYMDENATNAMLVTRNNDWVKQMPQMMEARSNMFAVGAAHLANDYGIIHLLRQQGYKVTPVSN